MSRFFRLIWLFVLASMAGFLLESGESLWSLGYLQNRQGLLYGPFAPVYGAGAVVLALLWPVVKSLRHWAAFAVAALAGTVVEYLWSWGQEVFFHTAFWDYRHFRFHLDGRVNLVFSLLWGLLGMGFWLWIWPIFQAHWPQKRPGLALAGAALTLLLAGDCLLSAAALSRQAQRQQAVAALSPFQLYLDKTWPDETLAECFPTMRLIEKGQTD